MSEEPEACGGWQVDADGSGATVVEHHEEEEGGGLVSCRWEVLENTFEPKALRAALATARPAAL